MHLNWTLVLSFFICIFIFCMKTLYFCQDPHETQRIAHASSNQEENLYPTTIRHKFAHTIRSTCLSKTHNYVWHVSTSEIKIFLPSLLHFWISLNSSAFAKTPGLVHRILIFSLNGVALVPLFLTSRSQLERDLSSFPPGCLPCWMIGLGTRWVHYVSYYTELKPLLWVPLLDSWASLRPLEFWPSSL